VFVARHRRHRVVRKVAGLCRRYLGWFDNASHDINTNGERLVLQAMGRLNPRVVLDVGAHRGQWTIACKACCPTAEVHAFEIARPTYERLVAGTRHLEGVHCRMVGMSDAPGHVLIRYYPDLPSLTTTTQFPHPYAFEESLAEVTTGDMYVQRHHIEHIDLLKIDVEGMEHRVLQGFEGMMARHAIDLVQFEYGRASLVTGYLLRDFHAYFRQRGFVVGKIYPTYVDFRDYTLDDEDFIGPNYLACKADKAADMVRLCHLCAQGGGGAQGTGRRYWPWSR
jgi:FkbM family methyltransferase